MYLIILGLIMGMLSMTCVAENAVSFESIGTSADSIAAGGIYGVSESAHSLFENPSLLGTNYNVSVDVFYVKLLGEADYNTLSVAKRFGRSVVGVGYSGVSVQNIVSTAESGDEFIKSGSYNYALASYYLGAAHELSDKVRVGAAIKSRYSNLANTTSSGFNMDVGVTYDTPQLIVSSVIKNAAWFQNVTYKQGSDEEFPISSITTIKGIVGDFMPMAQVTLRDTTHAKMLVATGLKWHPPRINQMAFLAGYKQVPYKKASKGRFSTGLSLSLKGISIDYAYEDTKDVVFYTNNHYVSMKFKF